MTKVLPRRTVIGFPEILRRIRRLDAHQGRERLQQEFRDRYGHGHAFATSSGRQGLRLLIRAARGRVPARAYVPSYTIDAVPAIFREEGYEVRFVDVDPDTLSLTPRQIESACNEPGLLLVTHYFGLPADMDAVIEAAGSRSLRIVEDCAHAPGATVRGRPVGSFGLGGFFSFETRKPLNGLGGGLVVTGDTGIAESIRDGLAGVSESRFQDAKKLFMTTAEWIAWSPPVFQVVSRALHRDAGRAGLVSLYRKLHAGSRVEQHAFSDFQSALVLDQIQVLDAAIRHKQELARVYQAILPGGLVLPVDPGDRRHGFYMYVVQHPRAGELGRFLRSRGIDCGIGPEVLPACAPASAAPYTALVAANALELPMYPTLEISDVERVCAVVREWFQMRG
jgi:dTDP-4-amino-4,6-dideoxygalactose transaminase